MLMIVPEDKLERSPQWWSSERYDYCDVIIGRNTPGNLVSKLIKKFSQIFA